MKKLLILFLCLFILSACSEPLPPVDMLTEFVRAYGAEGVIYHSGAREGDEGYLSERLAVITFGNRSLPSSYAVLLNTHLDTAYECGIFLIEGDRDAALELCATRAALLDPRGERTYIAIYGRYVFYSTLADKSRAKSIADKVFS